VAARSKVEQLPEEVRQELEQRLIKSGFSGYEQWAAWLQEQGFEISKSSLHRWGSSFEDRCAALRAATQQAKAIVAATPDDEGDMTEALMRLMQERLFTALVDLEVDPKKVNLASLAKALAPIARASIAQKKYASEVRERARAVVEAVDRIASSGGLTADGAATLRAQILGISGGNT
jgi:hypothetical protein